VEPTPTTEWIHEGPTRLLVPAGTQEAMDRPTKTGRIRGPGRIEGGAFYNPAMRFNRELSLLFIEHRLRAVAQSRRQEGAASFRLLDALAATGARVVRIANEATLPPDLRLHAVACDRDPRVVALLRQNIQENGVADKVAGLLGDMHEVALEHHWDHIDIDPFGSPAPFLDTAVRRLSNRGTLALTATDTAALTGSAPAACRRRYHARPWRGAGMHEAGLRILAGAAVQAAARHEIALRPVLAHATDHYLRVYLEALRGAGRADEALQGIGWIVEGPDGTVQTAPMTESPPSETKRWAGPMWTDDLQDRGLVSSIKQGLAAHSGLERTPITKFLERAKAEVGAPALYYEIGDLARAARCGPPRMESFLEAIQKEGYMACRAHASETGVKSDMPLALLVDLVKQREKGA
jgi:tRNA (guanine26-N2/guanine27-N2)-dimethyltransferase